MSLVDPFFGDQQRHVAALDVDRPVEDPLRPIARDRHTDLLSDVTIGVIQRGSLRDDRLVEHQQDRASLAVQTAFQPPFDCRHVSGRRSSS